MTCPVLNHVFNGAFLNVNVNCTFVMHSWEKREKMDSYTCNISVLTILIEIHYKKCTCTVKPVQVVTSIK